MRKTPQRRRDAHTGDCFEACVATILEVDLDEVPRYVESTADMRGYLARLDGWLGRTHRLALVALNRRCAEPVDRLPDYVGDETLWIAFLELGAPHVHHAVVMRGRQLVWDPDGAEDLSVLPDLLERVMTVVLFVPVASVLAR